MNTREEFVLVYDGPPTMDGPQRTTIGRFPNLLRAQQGYEMTLKRSTRAPKPNLRIQKRLVTEWEDVE